MPPSLGLLGAKKFTYVCRAASLPPMQSGIIEVPFMGRKIKLDGDLAFDTWTTTIMNDEDFLIKSAVEKWKNAMQGIEFNVRSESLADENSYKVGAGAGSLDVVQYGKKGDVLRQYQIVGAFPQVVSEMEMNWEAANQIGEFQIVWAYDYWLPVVEGDNAYLDDATTPSNIE